MVIQSTKNVKNDEKKTGKSVLYHKDGVIFVSMYKALSDEHLSSFTSFTLPKGLKMTCNACGAEIVSWSEKYRSYYCSNCLRLYPLTTYNLDNDGEKKALQEWTELIRPIVPSTKKKAIMQEESYSTTTEVNGEPVVLKGKLAFMQDLFT